MNHGQSHAKAKRPRKSRPKRGAFKLTPARVKAQRCARQRAQDETEYAYLAVVALPEHQEPPCPI